VDTLALTENAMAPTGTTDRTVFWQDHVTTWQASGLGFRMNHIFYNPLV